MKVAVTGANGLVGSHLCRHLETRGDQVLRLRRGAARAGELEFDLGRAPQPHTLAGIDALVHCAHDFKAAGWDAVKKTNVDGSLALLEAARQAGISKIVFISSISAFDGCRSHYGRGKLIVEKAACDLDGVAVRAGLIFGDAQGRGMFGALARLARLPVLPVFSGGRQPLYPVHVDDLTAFLGLVLRSFDAVRGRVLYAASKESVAMRELLVSLGRWHGRNVRVVSIPGWLALAGLRFTDQLRLPIGFRSDNLISMLNFDPAPAVSESALGMQFRALDLASEKGNTDLRGSTGAPAE